MKKIVFGALVALALTSCAKDYTCECTGKSFIEDPATDVNYSNTVNGTKKDAKSTCEGQGYSNVKAEVTCTLK